MANIYSDLNVRLKDVNPNDVMIITDSKAIMQSLIRLIKTEEGEIPNYRYYGLDLKQFLQLPLAVNTGKDIFDHIKDKIQQYEKRVDILGDFSQIIVDYDTCTIKIIVTVQVKSNNEILTLPAIEVPIQD